MIEYVKDMRKIIGTKPLMKPFLKILPLSLRNPRILTAFIFSIAAHNSAEVSVRRLLDFIPIRFTKQGNQSLRIFLLVRVKVKIWPHFEQFDVVVPLFCLCVHEVFSLCDDLVRSIF